MEENQIQIRAIGQLDATKLSLCDDSEAGDAAHIADNAIGFTVLADEIGITNFKRLLQYQFRKIGQVVAYLHDRQPATEVDDRYSKQAGPLKLPKAFDSMLAV